MDKNELRSRYKNLRKSLCYDDFSLKITGLSEYKNAKTVFIYLSFKDEARTDILLNEALKEKRVLVPCCTDNKGTMIAVEIKSKDDLKEGFFGIREPKEPVAYNGKIDLSVVPGLAFSKDGHRLGYGKGYYDRFLSKHDSFKVGLTFDELITDCLPHNEFDKKVDIIITPGKEIKIK